MSRTQAFQSISAETLYVFVPRIAGGVAALLLQLYLVRHLDPAEYGVFGLSLTCLMIFESFIGSALDLGLLREAPTLRANTGVRFSALERAALMLKLIAGLCGLMLALTLGDWVGERLFQQANGSVTFMAIVCAGTSLLVLRSLQVSFQLSHRFRLYGGVDLMHTGLRVALICGLIALGTTSSAMLMTAYALAALIVTVGFGFPLCKEVGAASWFTFTDCRQLMRYGGSVLVVGAFSLALASVDKFALAILSTPANVGLYHAALTIAMLPEIVGTCLAQVLSPRITAYCQAGVFPDFFMRLQRVTFVVCGILFVLGLLLTKPVVSLLFPPQYGAAIDLIVILLPVGLAGLIAFPAAVNFLAFYSLRTLFLIDGVMAPFLVVAYYFAAKEGGVVAVAWVTVAARCIKALALHMCTARLARRMVPCVVAVQDSEIHTNQRSTVSQPFVSAQ